MATTTNYSWTTPDDTDLVKDGAAAIRTLGSSADTTVKNLNPGTTAGDIDYYTSGTAKARIAIGTAGQILQVNSGATAPEWVTPAAGGFVGCILKKTSGGQTAASGVDTAITWNSETIDTDAFHDNSTNTSRITIPAGKGGKYLFSWNVSLITGASILKVFVNGTGGTRVGYINLLSGQASTASIILNLSATNYVELYFGQSTGNTQTIYDETNGASGIAYFACQYLGA